ncbi:NAD-dependent epimerase/dehydratase family protein [Streptomyces sp. 4N509B]|uniref:NAD-dependent epimerase/dehydratase family protein n=1 Tax=Streptomyces sp. 4N509B TaxID=3457413 RepID=UPI003FD541F9
MENSGAIRSPFRRAVVAGGAGFIGSHLCEQLIHRGAEVVCVDNFLTGRPENLAHLANNPRFQMVERDITSPFDVAGEVDVVFHLASPASPLDYLRLPLQTLEAGSTGTRHAVELAHRKNARFLLASTSEVYGEPLEHPQRESYWGNVNPIGPRSVYDEAKRFSEALVTAWRQHRGVDASIVRIFNCYGPRMRMEDGRAVPTFIRQSLSGEALTVAGDGAQTRSLCFVSDTVDGILALAESGHPGPVNIGGTEEITILDLAMMIRRISGSTSEIRFVAAPVDDPTRRRPDTTLARSALGWTTEVRLRDGLGRTIDWFTKQLRRAAT